MTYKNYCYCDKTIRCRYCVGQGKPVGPPNQTITRQIPRRDSYYINKDLLADSTITVKLRDRMRAAIGYPPLDELINELAELEKEYTMNDKLDTQDRFKQAIRDQQFIIGSVDLHGNMSFACSPRPQSNRAAARAECNRLAKLTPGKLYLFVQLGGGEFMPAIQATQSI